MPLIAIKPAGAGLVAMPRVRVNGRDDPVLRDPPRDPEHPILPLIEVLPDNGSQQRPGLLHALRQLPAVQRHKQRMRVLRERVDHRLARLAVLVIAHRLPRAGVVIITRQQTTQLALQVGRARGEQPADR